MNSIAWSRSPGPLLAALAFAAPLATSSPAQSPAPDVTLGTYVVSATRTLQDPALAPSSVTLLPLADLQEAQVADLRTALSETPGVVVANSGARGGQSSIFLRGANSDETLFVVDGVRLNTTTASYVNFLGGADLAGLDRIEVLRGPQSTLYGSSAMGGVILLETARGSGAPSGDLSGYAGSFGSLGAGVGSQGGLGAFDYSASLTRQQTDNDRAYNAFGAWNYSERLDDQVTPSLLVGSTLRGQVSHYEEPGPTTYPSPGDVQTVADLATAYADFRSGQTFDSRLTAAWYQDEYTWDKDAPDEYYARNSRDILDWQNSWQAAPWAELVGGVNAEQSYYQAGGLTTDRLMAGYLSSTFKPAAGVELTAGLRRDDFNTAGAATTGRAGAAWVLKGGLTKLRATYGTGFNAPTPDERYGEPPYLIPNPGIRPERSRGWDAGLDRTILEGRVTLEATWFGNRFRDLLEDEITNPVTYAGQEVNVDRARTSGVELGLGARPSPLLTLRAAYTYLEAWDESAGQRLIQRPRHTLDAGAERRLTRGWLAGAGVHLVSDRVDGAYAPSPLPGYATVRLYTSWAIRRNLVAKLRVENLLNRRYQEVAGYPALPLGVYAGTEWRF